MRGESPTLGGVGETAVIGVDDPRWGAFAARMPDATAFHRPAWARTLAGAYRFDAFAVVRMEQEEIVSGAPMMAVGGRRARRWISLPFTDVCPPLGDAGGVRALVADLERIRVAESVETVELRGAVGATSDSAVVTGVLHELELGPDLEEVRSRFHPSQVRRNIERAKREGVEVRLETTREALLETFYRLHLLTRRRQGVPIQPRRFFTRLWEEMIAPGGGFVLVARVNDRAAAAAVFLDGNRTLTYKFGASDPGLLRARPNHAIFSTAIEWACRAGRRTLDMGRTDPENDGLRAFKASWGAEERPLVYTHLGRPPAAVRDRAKLLRPVIRHSPAVVCRVLGEALYRRAA